MADKYLMKIGIDLEAEQLAKVTGMISDELSSMGKVSQEFVDKALAKAKEYNEEIEKQRKLIADIDEKLKQGGLDSASRQLLEQTKAKSEAKLKDYEYGNADKNMDSKAVVDAMSDYAQSFKESEVEVNKSTGKLVGGLAKFASGINAAISVVSMFSDTISSALDSFSKISNKLNPLGAFGDSGQRDIMTRYGMSGTQAMGFSNTIKSMGMSEQDVGKMTSEQKRVFDSLNNFWNEGMGKLDPDALDRYTKSMSDYQELQAKFQMGIQMTIMKLVSNSPKFNEFVGKVGDLLDAVLDFFGSPVVQAVFDGLVDFLTTVVTILEKAMRFISKIPGFGGGNAGAVTNNNTNNTSNQSFNIYGSDYQNNSELARQISYSTQGSYKG